MFGSIKKEWCRALCLVVAMLCLSACAGKKCARCNAGGPGGGAGGGGAGGPAGARGGRGTHGGAGGGSDAREDALPGTGPSNTQPFGSDFDNLGPASPSPFAGNNPNGVPGLPIELDPRNLPSFAPPTGTAGFPVNPSGIVPGATGTLTNGVPPLPVSPRLHSAMGKCIDCHKRQGSQLSELLKDPTSLAHQFPAMDPQKLKDMISKTVGLTPDEITAIHQHVADARASKEALQRQLASQVPSSARPGCFVDESQRQALLATLPPVVANSPSATFLQASQQVGNIQFFDRTNVPLTWQSARVAGGSQGEAEALLTSPRFATNPDMMSLMGYHSDGAREFPWQSTAGIDISPSSGATKFVIPPARGPLMRLFNKTKQSHPTHFGTSANVNGPQLAWQYTEGTTFGETLRVRDPGSGQMIPFEIRLRTKMPNGSWSMDVLRPFANSQELAEGIRKLCASGSPPVSCSRVESFLGPLQNPPTRTATISQFVNANTMGTRRDPLSLSRTAIEATQKTANLQTLPDLPADLVRELLMKTPFKSVFNQPWSPGKAGTEPAWAATSNSNFNIFPRNYFAAFIPMNQNGCMKCHDSAGRHVDNFDPGPGQMNASAPNDVPRARTWYNFIPGDDGILSFHPFSAQAIATHGAAGPGSLDPCWQQKGLLQ